MPEIDIEKGIHMEARQENKLGVMPIPKLLVSMSLPLMVSMLIQALYNIVDGIYVAQLSKDALTATTLAFPAQMVMIAVSVGTGVGVNSLLARRLGAKRFDEVNSVACHGFVLSLFNYILFLLFGLFGSEWFIKLFTDDPNLISLGTDYLSVCCIFSFGAFFATMGERLLQATGKPMLSMFAQATGAVVNIIFDPILIFGQFGFPKMGITGAAVATVAGQIIACIVALGLNFILNKEIKVSFKNFRMSGKIVVDIYKVGLPSIIMQSIGSLMSIGMNKILIAANDSAVSVFGIYFKLQSFVFMPVFGLTQGLVPIIGYNYGAKRPARLKKAIKLAVISAALIMTVGFVVFQLFAGALLSLFEADAEMYEIGISALKIISIMFIPAAISIVFGNVLQGFGNGTVSMANSFLRQLVVLLPSAYFLEKYLGVHYAWYSFVIAEVVSLVFTVIMFTKVYRAKISVLEVVEEYEVNESLPTPEAE